MRIFPLNRGTSVRLQSRLRRVDKQLPRKVLADKAPNLGSLIILGDGREDDVIVSLVCLHLDGSKTVGMVKSELPRYGALENLKVYVNEGYKDIVFVFDQEDDTLSKLGGRIRGKLDEIGVRCEEEMWIARRVVRFSCFVGGVEFMFVVVVNGLDDVSGPSHKIEDHLVRLAGVAVRGDSKDAWNGLGDVGRLEVFRKIYADKDVAAEVFSQHFEGLGLLDR